MRSASQTLRTTSGWVLLSRQTGLGSPRVLSPEQVHKTVHADVDSRGVYDLLRSTRHFGGLVWQLMTEDKIGGLLKDMLTWKK